MKMVCIDVGSLKGALNLPIFCQTVVATVSVGGRVFDAQMTAIGNAAMIVESAQRS